MKLSVFLLGFAFVIFVIPVWLLLHYFFGKKSEKTMGFSKQDLAIIDELEKKSEGYSERIENLEKRLDGYLPDWRARFDSRK
mgnify:CR=1 FL=1